MDAFCTHSTHTHACCGENFINPIQYPSEYLLLARLLKLRYEIWYVNKAARAGPIYHANFTRFFAVEESLILAGFVLLGARGTINDTFAKPQWILDWFCCGQWVITHSPDETCCYARWMVTDFSKSPTLTKGLFTTKATVSWRRRWPRYAWIIQRYNILAVSQTWSLLCKSHIVRDREREGGRRRANIEPLSFPPFLPLSSPTAPFVIPPRGSLRSEVGWCNLTPLGFVVQCCQVSGASS